MKPTMKYRSTLIQMSTIIKTENKSVGENEEKLGTCGNVKCCSHCRNSMVIPQKF